ncbi:Disease resistance protein [Corchorus capsularis]|uniref:Disease resistance protein n=1 Tax=Corchorus capsularis TaxID=210143 RepID=A0A1R3J152_COCAP|nr:Disease resistance protein [Corchorus capsularis]
MSMAGEAAFSAFLELFAKLASYDHLLNFVTENKQVNQHLKEWQRVLPTIQAVVNDAEQKQMKDQNVKKWLVQFHGLAYDVEDILDEFAMEALHRKLHLHQDQASTSNKVRIPISTWFNFTNPSAFNFSKKMISKFEKISFGLNGLATQKWSLGLRKIDQGQGTMFKATKASLQQPRALMDETHVYGFGREKEKAEILEFLLTQNGNEKGVSMLQIVGLGGIGKTTLAQLVYNDSSINKSFDHKAWIFVSKDFDATSVTIKILQSISAKFCTCTGRVLRNLQATLKEKLLGTRFLLVLDNVWDENFDDLSILLKPFGVGTKIILTTTRSCKVSSVVSNAEAYPLQHLSDKDCLSVLTQHALNASDFSGHPELEKVGMKTARNCNGLPLAAKVIGGLLCTNLDYGVWKDISESGIWDLTEDKYCGVNPALLLSYLYLPPCLKRCFSYCSILPKDYDFEEEEIILLWKAEGFLQEANLKTQMEGLGTKYFQELVSRSFFQTSSRDKSRFVMHDLINDLAQFVAGEICFKLEGNEKPEAFEATRHSSYVRGLNEGAKKFEPFGRMKNLRTFLPIMMSSTNEVCYLTNTVLIDLLPKLACLRVLSLKGYSINALPNSFENLIHLRHLDFSYTNIRSLPASIFTLYNLETLLLKKCQCLEKLPSEIDLLVNLNHLDISGADSLKRMPSGIGKLTNLQRLSNFILAVDGWLQIQDLKNLVHLNCDLSLSGLENIIKAADACEAQLIDKSGLEGLCLMWSNKFDSYGRNKAVEEEVLNMLEPHRKLKTLSIENYGGAKFSTWMLDSSLKNLLSLTLNNCRNCKSLPPLGKLPLLKDLCIRGMHEVNKVGIEFYGDTESNAFASLEMLCLVDLPNWKEWDFDEVDDQVAKFPCLRHLCIRNCPQLLGRLPKSVHSLEALIIRGCPKLVVSVSNLPMLHELEIDGCAELVLRDYADFPALKKVSLSSISKFCISTESLQHLEISGCNELQLGSLGHLTSLQNLEILCFPQLVSLDAGEVKEEQLQLGKLCSIKSLTIRNCKRLERLPQYFRFLTFLTIMRIEECPCIVSISVNNLPPSLKMLVIKGCMNLQFLVDEGENASISIETSLLEHLEVINCPLESLSLPMRLQTLIISRCSKLVSLSTSGVLPTGLKQLWIIDCSWLESIVQAVHENSCLEYLRIWSCDKLKYLPKGLNKLKHVEKMEIWQCESLVSLTESGLPTTNLTVLSISNCRNLVALPNMQNLTALKELSLTSLGNPHISFAQVGFSTSLTSLTILVPRLSSSLLKWGILHKLTSLRFLYINGEECWDVVSFPLQGKGRMLPPSLTSITLEKFENLRHLSSKGFQNLTSLQELWMLDCSKLESLPEKDMLLSLSVLYIWGCPLLGNQCMWGGGREWSKICHIPEVRVNHQFIIPKPSWYRGGQP